MVLNLNKIIPGIFMLSVLLGSASVARSAPNRSVVAGDTAFALDLYSQLKDQPGNLFFSPYSISTCLAMTYAGARGETEQQMSQVLHLEGSPGKVHAAFGELQRQLVGASNQKGIELSIANSLWAQKGHSFLPAFLKIAQGDYQANVNKADFVTEAESVRGKINLWVAEKTRDKIQDILPRGSVTSGTRLVLANAIYFKGVWAKPYNKAATSTQPFHLSASRQVNVPLMRNLDEVRYMENDDDQAVELPYEGGELSMVVLLPRQIDGCSKLEEKLTPALLSRSLSQMKRHKVQIFLPRFTLESSFDLNSRLARMGMPDAFTSKADFSGLDGTRSLFISGVFHKAWGEVNEEGTEAAAATGVVVTLSAVRKPAPPPPVFRADHPFVFFIRDTRSGSILFLGRFADPAQ